MEQEPQPDNRTFYLYCSLHGSLGPYIGELTALRMAQAHEEATDGFCNVVVSGEKYDPDACDQWAGGENNVVS